MDREWMSSCVLTTSVWAEAGSLKEKERNMNGAGMLCHAVQTGPDGVPA
jgi:hypothetical protein